MSVALLDSVRRAEGARGINTYLKEKLAFMPPPKTRKAFRSTDSGVAAVKRTLSEYLETHTAFSIVDLCEKAEVSSSWLYNPARQTLRNDIAAAQKIVGKPTERRRLQTSPPEPELDPTAIAQQWLDAQIEQHQKTIKALQAKWVEVERQQEQERRNVAQLERDLDSLYKVRKLTQLKTEDESTDAAE